VGAIAVTAIGMSVVPMVLIPMAEQQITSILASLLNATTPLWTAMFVALLIPAERTTRAQLLGLVVGAGGIAVLVGAWDVHEFSLKGTLLMLTATAFYGIGGAMSRMLLTRVSARPSALAMTQVGLSAVILAPVALLSGSPEPGAFSPSGSAMWGLLCLGVFGTSFAYVMFWRVVKIAGATAAASVTYLVPIVATILGIAVLGETLHWYEPVGAAFVLSGVWLAGRTPRKGPHPRVAEPAGAPEADLA
jgi:drug/metabolite transporter (DMT)-like permease